MSFVYLIYLLIGVGVFLTNMQDKHVIDNVVARIFTNLLLGVFWPVLWGALITERLRD